MEKYTHELATVWRNFEWKHFQGFALHQLVWMTNVPFYAKLQTPTAVATDELQSKFDYYEC